MAPTSWIIIDELSMARPQHNDYALADFNVVLVGDPGQLPPVGDSVLWHALPSTPLAAAGSGAYGTFTHSVVLDVLQRQEDGYFSDTLMRIRDGVADINDFVYLSSRVASEASAHATVLCATRAACARSTTGACVSSHIVSNHNAGRQTYGRACCRERG